MYESGTKEPVIRRCNYCIACRITRAKEWELRFTHELSMTSGIGCFLTLTYNDDNISHNGTLIKADLQNFFKRLRKNNPTAKIKYFACGEYGTQGTLRPHYHIALVGWQPDDLYTLRIQKGKNIMSSHQLSKLWTFGDATIGALEPKSIFYVTKYILKKITGLGAHDAYGDLLPPFQLQSQGIGKRYALLKGEQLKKDGFSTVRGKRVGIPRYYRKVLDIDLSQYGDLPPGATKMLKHYKEGDTPEKIMDLYQQDEELQRLSLIKREQRSTYTL